MQSLHRADENAVDWLTGVYCRESTPELNVYLESRTYNVEINRRISAEDAGRPAGAYRPVAYWPRFIVADKRTSLETSVLRPRAPIISTSFHVAAQCGRLTFAEVLIFCSINDKRYSARV